MGIDDLPEEIRAQLEKMPAEMREAILAGLSEADLANIGLMQSVGPQDAPQTAMALLMASAASMGPRHVAFEVANCAIKYAAMAGLSEAPEGAELATLRNAWAAIVGSLLVAIAITADDETTPGEVAQACADSLQARHDRQAEDFDAARAKYLETVENVAGQGMERDVLADLESIPVFEGPVVGD